KRSVNVKARNAIQDRGTKDRKVTYIYLTQLESVPVPSTVVLEILGTTGHCGRDDGATLVPVHHGLVVLPGPVSLVQPHVLLAPAGPLTQHGHVDVGLMKAKRPHHQADEYGLHEAQRV